MKLSPIHLLIFFTLATALSVGCSSTPTSENDPAKIFEEAEDDIKSDHFLLAIEKLRKIKNKFPYSKFAVEAQLKMADVYYLQESYGEAATTYEAFRELHPAHEKAAYAMFRIGKSYSNEVPGTISRDLSYAKKAIDAYQDFLKKFPSSPDGVEAKKDIGQLRERLAEKELYIANFYYIRELFDSAKPRYKKILNLYPDTDAAKNAAASLKEIEGKPKKNEG